MPLTTRRFALSRAEYATTCAAAVVSSTAYVTGGFGYLARGVVGDLVGFGALALVGARTGRRARHEAAVCLACIGLVLALDPGWPLRLRESAWWALFVAGLGGYVLVRRRVCD